MGLDITAEVFVGKLSEDWDEVEAWEDDDKYASLEMESDWSGEWNMIGMSVVRTNPFTPDELPIEDFLQNLNEAIADFKEVFPNETPKIYLIPHMS